MENSPFGTLPREIRDKIYDYALPGDRVVTIVAVPLAELAVPVMMTTDGGAFSNILKGLPTTCKQIRQECLELAFSLNAFNVEIYLLTTDVSSNEYVPDPRPGYLHTWPTQEDKKETFELCARVVKEWLDNDVTASKINTLSIQVNEWMYLEDLDQDEMKAVYNNLCDIKTRLDPTTKFTAAFKFDMTDFNPVPGFDDEPISNVFTVTPGDTLATVKEVDRVANAMEAE